MPSLEADYPRYLASKRSVDDRAINDRVLRRLESELEGTDRLRVLNLGAGLGGVIERLVDREVIPENAHVECTAVDVRAENVRAASERLSAWARSQGRSITTVDRSAQRPSIAGIESTDNVDGDITAEVLDRFRVEIGSTTLDLSLVVGDAFAIAGRDEWDLLVGQAFLDLFEIREILPELLEALSPGGYCYFPITFDAGTIFEPPVEAIEHGRLEDAFHDHLDRDGDSHAGRHLLTELPEAGASVLAAGSSDWVVHAEEDAYPATEGDFLAFIVDTIAGALTESETDALEDDALEEWRGRRHEQIDNGELVYIAHQLDVLGQV